MKNIKTMVLKGLVKAIPACAALALFISANSVVSPWNGQLEAPKALKNYRKF